MTITLPDSIAAEVQAKAKAAGFSSVDEYVAYLIVADEPTADDLSGMPVPDELVIKSREDLEAKILEGLNSGPPIRATPEFWEDMRRRIRERAGRRKPAP
jgi:hypothetical protein